jgi:hypothetical protein
MAKLSLLCCRDQYLIEYWHEHDDCNDQMCYVQECESCEAYETLCGITRPIQEEN